MKNNKIESINTKPGFRPIWSVMIPTFNCADYLRQTLESVLCQDKGEDFMEIWVVDDNSTMDNPESVVEELGKGRVKFYKQDKNVGQLRNFETCIYLSKGFLIHILHGDDFIMPGFYDKLESPLLTNDSIGAAFTRHQHVDEFNNIISTSDVISTKPGILDNFIYLISSNQLIQTPSIVVKRKVYERLGSFNKNLSWCEDWEMWIRTACHYEFYYEPSILASYRVHKNSNSGASFKTGRYIDDVLTCMQLYLSYLPIYGSKRKEVIKQAKKNFLNYSLLVINEEKDKEIALLLLYKSLKLTYNLRSRLHILHRIIKIKRNSLVRQYNRGRIKILTKDYS